MVRVVLAALVIVLPALAQPAVSHAASSTGTLYGLGPNSIITIDPASGASSTFVNLPSVDVFPGPSYSQLVADAAGHRLFTQRTLYIQQPDGFLAATYQLVTVNIADPTATPTVSPDEASGITDMVYDPTTQRLFGQTNMYPFQLVRIDPATGAQTHLADIPGIQPLKMTIAPAKHSIYMPIEDFSQLPPVNTIATFNTTTGAVSQSPAMSKGIFALEYDTSTGVLYGKTFCCLANIVKVNPSTGAQTVVSTATLGLGSGITIDSSSHTIYMTDDEFGGSGFSQFIQAVDLRTGALSTSTGILPADTYVPALAFVANVVTPAQLQADIQSAIASGAISNAGIGRSLFAEAAAANAARSRGQCNTAANLYQAFSNEVSAQTEVSIAASAAAQLTADAQSLMTNCP